jgi:hypothetical protein
MRRLGTLLVVLLSIVISALLGKYVPDPPRQYRFEAAAEATAEVQPGLWMAVAPLVVTRELEKYPLTDPDDVFLVVEIVTYSERYNSGFFHANLVSGDKTFSSVGTASIPQPGFQHRIQFGFSLQESDLEGAKISAYVGKLVTGNNWLVEFDLGLDSQRVAELLAAADEPYALVSERTEVP